MTPTLFAALFLMAPAEAALYRGPPPPTTPCPWNQEALTPLWPEVDPNNPTAIIASNASLWFRVNDGVTPIGEGRPVLQDETGALVEMKETTLPIPTGALLELRPVEQLTPGNRYLLRYEQNTAELTASGPIFGAPNDEQFAEITPIDRASPAQACDTSGLLVSTNSDNIELHLFINDEDEILGVSNNSIIVIVETPGAQVCGRALAMDSVGRRSQPSERVCAFSASPARIPFDTAEDEGPFRGLGCTTADGARSDAPILIALFGAFRLLLRSRNKRS